MTEIEKHIKECEHRIDVITNSGFSKSDAGKRNIVILQSAILACEKQIPKKPLLGGNTDKLTGDIFICPSCSGIVGIDDVRGYYCADCGQKLDWENEHLKEGKEL